MLSRSSLSIRHLIPHRRPSVSDEDMSGAESKNDDLPLPVPVPAKDPNDGNTHAAKSRSNRKPRVPAPFIATSSLTHYDTLRPLPPLPTEIPRHSSSSLERCERHIVCDCPLLNSKRRSPRYTASSGENTEVSSLVGLEATGVDKSDSGSVDEYQAHRIPKSRFYLPSERRSKEEVRLPLSAEREHKEEAESEDKQAEVDSSPEYSVDIQQFMQEADDAFKSIGATISEVSPVQARFPPQYTEYTKPNDSDTAAELGSTPPTPPPKETPAVKEMRSSLSKSPHMRMSSAFSTLSDASHTLEFSSSAINRKKSKKSRRPISMRPQRKPAPLKQAAKSGPRWTITENVSELLTGGLSLFHKIQADEMLTPDQIEAFRKLRETKQQAEEMAEAMENDTAGDTPDEPFHLDDLPSRIGSAGVKTDAAVPSSSEDNTSIVFSDDVVQRNFLFEKQHKNSNSSSPPAKPPVKQSSLHHKSNTFPIATPSTTTSRHLRSASRGPVTELPIIPEACSTTEYVYLKASPYSLTTPHVRHGPIRLSKADLVPEVKLAPDEGLDWTAFQMAILGAGDWFTDSDDSVRRREAEEAAEIAEWWDSWHFQSPGGLVTRPSEASSPTSTLSGDEIPDISYPEVVTAAHNPHRLQPAWQDVRRRSGAEGLQLNLDFATGKHPTRYYMDTQAMNGPWGSDGEQKQTVNRDSVNSLPPSPMLDLRVIRSASGDFDVVPMGYNLGHDLGDFLKWEAEHAYAGDFHSPS
ncbi:hypothetical protein GGS20DRAFT_355759 [Poronia punctata]|nr:hypothetical protein GGS20DRAFT_355759 [Poronia punctata]